LTTYLLAVLSSIAYGSADFLGGLANKRSAPFFAVVVLQVGVLCAALAIVLVVSA
jgi:hypothetical protein